LREEFDQAVLNRFRGAPSGEHGIGRIRAETLPRVWGDEVYGVMRRIKDALDPRGLLNPGVLFSTDPWWATWGGLESRLPM
jgi:FAD/FMN-containing dehydrogenase